MTTIPADSAAQHMARAVSHASRRLLLPGLLLCAALTPFTVQAQAWEGVSRLSAHLTASTAALSAGGAETTLELSVGKFERAATITVTFGPEDLPGGGKAFFAPQSVQLTAEHEDSTQRVRVVVRMHLPHVAHTLRTSPRPMISDQRSGAGTGMRPGTPAALPRFAASPIKSNPTQSDSDCGPPLRNRHGTASGKQRQNARDGAGVLATPCCAKQHNFPANGRCRGGASSGFTRCNPAPSEDAEILFRRGRYSFCSKRLIVV